MYVCIQNTVKYFNNKHNNIAQQPQNIDISVMSSCSQAPPNSRFTILNWINDTLLLPLSRIEQLGSGNIYCQLIDAAYPQRIQLNKVKWDAKLQVQFLHNFKILQSSFQYLGINKKIDIQKLAKAKYQDNLQFIQWLKLYIEDKIDYDNYQPLKRRNYAKIYLGFVDVDKKKFNVMNQSQSSQSSQNQNQSVHNYNKQNHNLDSSSIMMKSSIKSNISMNMNMNMNMKSSVLKNRGSMSNLINMGMGMSVCGNKDKDKDGNKKSLKTLPDEKDQNIGKPNKGINTNGKVYEKRKNIGPISSVLCMNKKATLTKNQSAASILQAHQKSIVKNVDVIQSEGSEDEFF